MPKEKTFVLLFKRGEGNPFPVTYRYTGRGKQDGYTFVGWVLACINKGVSAGLQYIGRGDE